MLGGGGGGSRLMWKMGEGTSGHLNYNHIGKGHYLPVTIISAHIQLPQKTLFLTQHRSRMFYCN